MSDLITALRRAALGAAIALSFAGGPWAQTWPSQPVKVIIGYNPGGSVDIVTRLVAERLTGILGQQVVVENRPGGGTVIASEAVARAPADGYTIMNADIAHGANPALMDRLPYDPLADFVALGKLAEFPAVLVVGKDSPVTSVAGLVELAKSKPGELNYSSSGVGSLNFLASELFKAQNGLDIQHIPYASGGEAVTALVGGFVDMLITTVPPVRAQAENLRILAVSADARLDSLPDVPTFAEAGFPDFRMGLWQGFLAPRGTDPAIVARLNEALLQVAAMPDIQTRINDLGGSLAGSSPEDFDAFIRAEVDRWKQVITPEMRQN